MNWSWRMGRLAGIDIYMHFTFLLLLGWVGYQYYAAKPTVQHVLLGLATIAVLFFIIVLHELGHALAARRYGIETRDITLLPIGGLARLERMPEKPSEELVVALAGPAVNVVMAIALFIGLFLAGELAGPEVLTTPGTGFIKQLLWINIILACFNLIPAFPMDGGRVLRALLAMRMSYVKATALAASIGQGMAVLFGFAGLFYNPWLLFIALFVWLGAEAEANQVSVDSVLSGIPVQESMITRFAILSPTQRVTDAAQVAHGNFQQDFPVVQDGRLVGLLPRAILDDAIASKRYDRTVGDVMLTGFPKLDPRDRLDTVQRLLNEDGVEVVPVVRQGQLLGLVTPESLGRYLIHRRALRGRPQPQGENLL